MSDDFINFRTEYSDIYGHTVLHPAGLIVLVLLALATFLAPRRYAFVPILVLACCVPPAQRVMIANLNFTLLRLLVVCAWARVCIRREAQGLTWKALDSLVITASLAAVVTCTLQEGSYGAFVFAMGNALDAVGLYFLVRCWLRSWSDVIDILDALVVISVPVGIAFLIELNTGRNLFAFLGGLPYFTLVREGRLRCQGAFAHPILAGVFWATSLPLLSALWWRGGSARRWALAGTAMSLFVVLACSSSTPIVAVLMCILGACMFRFRGHMRSVRWALLFTLLGLHAVMKGPVWSLLARFDVVGGSTGYQRYVLIDGAIRHISEWFWLGTRSTAHWGWGTEDVASQYVWEAVQGGVGRLGLFIAILVYGFKAVGQLGLVVGSDRSKQALTWALGVALFAHCMSFFSVSYWGQIIVAWYLLLGIIASLTPGRNEATLRRARRPAAVGGGPLRLVVTKPCLLLE